MIKKPLILFILFFLFAGSLKAQNCIEQTDLLTGKKIISGTTELKSGSGLRHAYFSFTKIDTNLLVSFSIISSQQPININNLKLSITYTNGQVKNFDLNKNIQINNSPLGTGILFQSGITFEELNFFQNNAIASFMLVNEGSSPNNLLIFSITVFNADQIINSASCLTKGTN